MLEYDSINIRNNGRKLCYMCMKLRLNENLDIWWVEHISINIWSIINTLRPRQNVRRFAEDTFKRIFLNENVWKSIKISLKFVPKVPINNIPALVQIMAWRRPGDKPLSEPMVVSLPTHICVARPQWVNETSFRRKNGVFMYVCYETRCITVTS